MPGVQFYILVYVLIGLCFAAYAWHKNNTQEGVDDLTADVPDFYPPEVHKAVFYLGMVVMSITFIVIWPLIVVTEAYWGVIEVWCRLFHDHSDENEGSESP